MKEDTSLFKYELAIVLIVKNAAVYMGEWIEYHLLAGVDHFYIYDNDSEDNLKEVLQPYIAAGRVDYEKISGKSAQCVAYNDAVQKYRFDCRYMAFIDDDEFIRVVDNSKSIKDVIREIFDQYPTAAGLTMFFYTFGSNGHEKADYSVNVIERFLRRDANPHKLPKMLVNPRQVDHVPNPHYTVFFKGLYAINSEGIANDFIDPKTQKLLVETPVTDKIFINHYTVKSREEYLNKCNRGDVFFVKSEYSLKMFAEINASANEVFDDGILNYCNARCEQLENGYRGGILFTTESSQDRRKRLFNALIQNLLPACFNDVSKKFFEEKACIFLQCRAVSHALKSSGLEYSAAEYFEELSLRCLLRTMTQSEISIYDCLLFFEELPKLLPLKYPIVDRIREFAVMLLSQVNLQYRLMNEWSKYKNFNYIVQLLERK